MQDPTEPPAGASRPGGVPTAKPLLWISIAFCVAVLAWFYGGQVRYGAGRDLTAAGWLWSAWNGETDYEHGPLFPLVILGLVVYQWKALRAAMSEGSAWGLAAVFVGVLLYAAAFRTLQPRIAMGGLPFILWGSVLYLWGWKVARLLAFPLFFFWLAIPLPSFQQATTQLQLLSTSLAHHGSDLCGVQTYVKGTTVLPVNGNWKPLDIATGCSGIRSLMALLMISSAWAYVAKMPLWKKVVLFAAAFPLAILGNALRVISIFVIAQYVNEKWASGTWHDWSGLLLFYPFTLALLLGIHSLLEGGLPWKKGHRKQTRRTVVTRHSAPDAFQTGS